MSQMEIDSVLAQIRALSAQAGAGVGATRPAETAAAGPSAFASILKQGLEQVNQTQLNATHLADAFDRGTAGVELPQVMLEMQKASVSFRALAEVRNRLISAYQEIMNMQM